MGLTEKNEEKENKGNNDRKWVKMYDLKCEGQKVEFVVPGTIRRKRLTNTIQSHRGIRKTFVFDNYCF